MVIRQCCATDTGRILARDHGASRRGGRRIAAMASDDWSTMSPPSSCRQLNGKEEEMADQLIDQLILEAVNIEGALPPAALPPAALPPGH